MKSPMVCFAVSIYILQGKCATVQSTLIIKVKNLKDPEDCNDKTDSRWREFYSDKLYFYGIIL